MQITFNGTITAGELLQVISFLIAVFAAYNRITNQITEIKSTLRPIYDWWQAQIESGMVRQHKIKSGGD